MLPAAASEVRGKKLSLDSRAGRLFEHPNCFSANPWVFPHHSRHLAIRDAATAKEKNRETGNARLRDMAHGNQVARILMRSILNILNMQVIARGNLQFCTAAQQFLMLTWFA